MFCAWKSFQYRFVELVVKHMKKGVKNLNKKKEEERYQDKPTSSIIAKLLKAMVNEREAVAQTRLNIPHSRTPPNKVNINLVISQCGNSDFRIRRFATQQRTAVLCNLQP